MFRRPTFCAITLASLAVALLQGVNTASAGPLTFDHFTAPGSTVQILGIAAGGGTPSATVSNLQTGVGGLTFGTWREITIQRTGGSGLANSDINTSVASHWAVSNGPLTGSFSTVRYDFAAQGFNLDFSGTGSIDLGGIDLDAGQVDFSIQLIDGVNVWTSPNISVLPGANQNISFLIAGAGSILNSVDRFIVRANTNILINNTLAGSDFSVDVISLPDDTVRINEVPEPASMAVFGILTLAGGVIARRRMAKTAA